MFLSASKVTVSPALISWSFLPVFSPFVVAAEVAFQAAALMASATLPTVAILFSSPAVTVGTAVVLMFPVLTLTPSAPTVKDLSAAFTVILLVASSFFKPSPRFALYLILLVLPSVFSTDTLVPSPSTKLTVS